MQRNDRRPFVCTISRLRSQLDQWFLRLHMHIAAFPYDHLYRRIGRNHRQVFRKDMQFPRRDFLSPLHHTLPYHVPVLRMAMEERLELQPDMAGSTRHIHRNPYAGICMLQAIRRACTQVDQQTSVNQRVVSQRKAVSRYGRPPSLYS